MAFALEGFISHELKDDPRYVKAFAFNRVELIDGSIEVYPI